MALRTDSRQIYMFMNAYYSKGYGLSGGDKRSLEILRRWMRDGRELPTILAPGKIFEILKSEKVSGFQKVVTSEKDSQSKNILSAYRIHERNAMRYVRGLCGDGDQNGGYSARKGSDLEKPHGADPENLVGVRSADGVIFYTTSDYFTDVLPAEYGRTHLAGSKWVAVIHHIIEDYHTRPGSRLHNWAAYREQQFCIRKIIGHADRILTVSPLVYDYLKQQGVPEERLELVSNGIDDAVIAAEKPFTNPDKQSDGIFVARFAKSKGILEIPAIWEKVAEKVPGARLCLIGEGDEEIKRKLEEEFRSRGIDSLVSMPGFVPSEELYSWLKSSKVCVFPSHEEGWGIAIAEAMGCGLPVVTYDLPVFPQIFHGINLSGPVGDTETFASQIIDLLQNPEKREKIGMAGKDLVDTQYTWDRVAEQEWESIHRETGQKDSL